METKTKATKADVEFVAATSEVKMGPGKATRFHPYVYFSIKGTNVTLYADDDDFETFDLAGAQKFKAEIERFLEKPCCRALDSILFYEYNRDTWEDMTVELKGAWYLGESMIPHTTVEFKICGGKKKTVVLSPHMLDDDTDEEKRNFFEKFAEIYCG